MNHTLDLLIMFGFCGKNVHKLETSKIVQMVHDELKEPSHEEVAASRDVLSATSNSNPPERQKDISTAQHTDLDVTLLPDDIINTIKTL